MKTKSPQIIIIISEIDTKIIDYTAIQRYDGLAFIWASAVLLW